MTETTQQPATIIAIAASTIGLRTGEHYAGAPLDEAGNAKQHLVLMAEKPPGRLTWREAMDWAKNVGGELPTRQEAALLFANCKPHLEAAWHWTSETYESNSSYAWSCYFNDGGQDDNVKSLAGCARAVRRLDA